MLIKLKQIVQSNLFKITSLNSASIVLKITVGFVTSKFIALFVGPSGMALVGNFRNFLSSIQAIATLGFENGIIKYVSENKNNELFLKKTITTITLFLCFFCLFISVVLFVFSDSLTKQIFDTNSYGFLFKFVAVALPFYTCSLLLIAIINGLGCFKKVLLITCIGYLIGLLVSVLLIYNFKINGALLAIIITPSLLFFVSLYFIQTEINVVHYLKFNFFEFKILKQFSSYSLMVFVSSVIGPIVLLLIRKYLIEKVGSSEAGFWEAITRISSYYMLFITSLLSLYFLPKLAESATVQQTKLLFLSYFKTILPIFGFVLFLVYAARFYIISILLTDEFVPTEKLFFWQLLGDFLRAASYILAFQFYAKKLTKGFILSELLSLSVLYCSSIYFVAHCGFVGIVMAHCFTYFIYLIGLLIYFKKEVFSR